MSSGLLIVFDVNIVVWCATVSSVVKSSGLLIIPDVDCVVDKTTVGSTVIFLLVGLELLSVLKVIVGISLLVIKVD